MHDAARDALVALGTEVEGALMATLRDDREWVRVGAIEALGRQRSRRAVDRLTGLLGDADVGVRSYTCEALGRIGGHRSMDALIDFEQVERERIAQGGPPDAANAAVEALIELGYYEGYAS